MSPCPSRSYDYESVLENLQATTIATITRSTRPSRGPKRPSHAPKIHGATTETVDKIIIVVGVETEYVSAGGPLGTDRGFVTSKLATSTTYTPAPVSASASKSLTESSSSAPTSSFAPTSSSVPSPGPIGSSSFSTGSSSTDLKAVSGAKATLQPQGTGLNNDNSPTGTGTGLQASISSTSTPLKASTTSQSVPVGAILGVVIAGVLMITLVVLLLVLWARRRSARAARVAGAPYDGGMRQEAPLTPYPADLQPNRAGGGRVQNWMLRNSHLAGADQPSRGGPAAETYNGYPTLVTNQQYLFAPPVVLSSPQRPTRQRGDTLSTVEFF
ncbi:hypothetical protein FB451DRAFT_1212281 [Mycena latifolia]|nr:hypothetical protein FB451DRAFT_1212281 [Mycena latifolia]